MEFKAKVRYEDWKLKRKKQTMEKVENIVWSHDEWDVFYRQII
jgi:hypothetical protein